MAQNSNGMEMSYAGVQLRAHGQSIITILIGFLLAGLMLYLYYDDSKLMGRQQQTIEIHQSAIEGMLNAVLVNQGIILQRQERMMERLGVVTYTQRQELLPQQAVTLEELRQLREVQDQLLRLYQQRVEAPLP